MLGLQFARALTSAIRLSSFPSFCAFLVGGSTVSPVLIFRLCELVNRKLGSKANVLKSQGFTRFIRFVAAFLSSLLSLRLLNQKPIKLQETSVRVNHDTQSNGNVPSRLKSNREEQDTRQFAGRTMDLTLFTLTRAVDAMVCLAWSTWCHRRKLRNCLTKAESVAPQLADAGAFAASSAIVMWAWFYLPERLPRSYGKWIGEIAKVDTRLIEALRHARRGEFVYGKDTGQAPLLESMCKDYSWPLEWGNPQKTAPIPCEMVHMDCGPNCEMHAITRFARTFKLACATYIPLQIAFRPRAIKSVQSLVRALSEAMRSSAFLSAFVTLFYYSVCLARTRVGPKMFDQKTVTTQMWDSGLCVGAGCFMCGWSILVENPRKRQELALFVAPRAAATVLPRVYSKEVCLISRPCHLLTRLRWRGLHLQLPMAHWCLRQTLSLPMDASLLTVLSFYVVPTSGIRNFCDECGCPFHSTSRATQHDPWRFWEDCKWRFGLGCLQEISALALFFIHSYCLRCMSTASLLLDACLWSLPDEIGGVCVLLLSSN